MSEAYTIGIIVFDGVLTSEVVGPAEVFAIAGQRDWFDRSKVLLIGVDPQPTIRTEEGLRLAVDATIADDLTLDVLLVPGGNDMTHFLQHEKLNAFIQQHEGSCAMAGQFLRRSLRVGERRCPGWQASHDLVRR